MQPLDYVVLVGYFLVVIVIGIICSRWTKAQEDYFMGGRSFGKLLQTFAAFGAGTGSNDPIQVGRTTWTSGLSGIWSVLLWLFCTPFYWIFGVWYRRMRHLTIGDWFAERYESRGLGAGYTVFGISFYILYLSTMFSAISKVATPLLGFDSVTILGFGGPVDLKYVLVPVIAVVVIGYGIVGGLRAAYWTDLIQGMCIILLSIILIPAGLHALAAADAGPDAAVSWLDGFRVMHERMTPDYFTIVGGPRSGEFPLYYIVSLTLLALTGIVVQPHFIATGGGSAKTELSARTGLVVGNFLKRFCTIGWALTGLIALAYLAGNLELAKDHDRVWGVASRELLGPLGFGLVGLMLACLLAALMSSADAYMLVSSALVTRNVYAAYINPHASERRYVQVGRMTGLIIIVGAMLFSLILYDVFKQFLLAIELPIIFAAPFWIGMYWRRATRLAAWATVAFSTLFFFVIPPLIPAIMPGLQDAPAWNMTNNKVTTIVERQARYVDVHKREAERILWQQDYDAALKEEGPDKRDEKLRDLGAQPPAYLLGETIRDKYPPEGTGGKPIFWTGKAVSEGEKQFKLLEEKEMGKTTVIIEQRLGEYTCKGRFKVDFLVYRAFGIDLTTLSDATLTTLRLPTRIVLPFLVMILFSFVTPKNSQQGLDRYYTKMKTPVDPNPEEDKRQLELSIADPRRFDSKRLLPWTQLEIQKPTLADVVGFVVCFIICFLFIGVAMWVASIGG